MARVKFVPILPKPVPVQVFTQAFNKAAREIEGALKDEFNEATKTWKTQPTFRGYVRISGDSIYISVGTSDPIFGYVDQGTKPHIIRPVKAKVLHWVDPRTGEDHYAKEVHHPGFAGRHITDDIRDRWEDGLMAQYINDHLEVAVQRSGHAVK